MSNKRRRGPNTVRAARRPIDKNLISVAQRPIAGTQLTTDIRAAVTFPSTVTGLRWDVSVVQEAGTAFTVLVWAIVVVPQGTVTSVMSVANGATFYSPEKNVLTWGIANSITSSGALGKQWIGSTKTMRKLQVGDKIVMICLASATNTWSLNATVQYFLKT